MSLNLAVVIQVATTQVSYVIEPGRGDTGGHYSSKNSIQQIEVSPLYLPLKFIYSNHAF